MSRTRHNPPGVLTMPGMNLRRIARTVGFVASAALTGIVVAALTALRGDEDACDPVWALHGPYGMCEECDEDICDDGMCGCPCHFTCLEHDGDPHTAHDHHETPKNDPRVAPAGPQMHGDTLLDAYMADPDWLDGEFEAIAAFTDAGFVAEPAPEPVIEPEQAPEAPAAAISWPACVRPAGVEGRECPLPPGMCPCRPATAVAKIAPTLNITSQEVRGPVEPRLRDVLGAFGGRAVEFNYPERYRGV